jgi:hypothetical protein
LDAAAVEAFLKGLQPYPYGWRRELPAPYRFFGQPIAVTIETRPFPADSQAPPPAPAEIDLVRRVVNGLPGVLAAAERAYAAYNADFPELVGKVRDPRVWVCREYQAADGPDRWALESGIADAPDWTICVEFRGLAVVEVWSGD